MRGFQKQVNLLDSIDKIRSLIVYWREYPCRLATCTWQTWPGFTSWCSNSCSCQSLKWSRKWADLPLWDQKLCREGGWLGANLLRTPLVPCKGYWSESCLSKNTSVSSRLFWKRRIKAKPPWACCAGDQDIWFIILIILRDLMSIALQLLCLKL